MMQTFLDQKCYYFMVRSSMISFTISNHVHSHWFLYYMPLFDLVPFFLRLGNLHKGADLT